MKTTLRVAILMAIIVATMGTVSADHSSAQAAMSAAASQLGGMGADVIGGYGGSGSSGSSTGSQSAAASTNANLGFILATPSGSITMPSMADIKAKSSANLATIGEYSTSPATQGSLVDSMAANHGYLLSEPSSDGYVPSMSNVQRSISSNLGSLSGGISSGAAGNSGGSSPYVSSPCAGVMTSSVPASAATYAAVHGA